MNHLCHIAKQQLYRGGNKVIDNGDGTLTVVGYVLIIHFLSLLPPIKTVNGHFTLRMRTNSLVGCPRRVEGDVDCYGARLRSLAGAPECVGGDFDCGNNRITSLEGAPRYIGGKFLHDFNQIKPEDLSRYKIQLEMNRL